MLGSKKDRHEKVGRGHLGLELFRTLVTDSRFKSIPLILETPNDIKYSYSEEIAFLHQLQVKFLS
jgi:deoxyribonuclease-4